MVHAPCGELNRSSPCMKDEKCTKRNPKPFLNETVTDVPGGTGKIFLINLVLAEIRANKEIIFALASSGTAAIFMDGGLTAYSGLKLLLNVADYEFPVCDITKSSAHGQIVKQCKAIIWDESTMAHRKPLEALNRTPKIYATTWNVMSQVTAVSKRQQRPLNTEVRVRQIRTNKASRPIRGGGRAGAGRGAEGALKCLMKRHKVSTITARVETPT
ncbi:hypothetical protein EVAR_23244_1 [Eumeta japonica]|uniref:ATP-dependent DNA helicase n=1 Tax=Eumeta variegata TaxID=151549 RepID=A0A4C1VDL2_EUMVA|nr:hypothetical protein EVAR_23244_1 [Eumeta japonica]